MTRIWPRRFAGQMALLIALALFVAQAINFGLVLRDRAQFRLEQATRPVAVRIADALDREVQGKRALAPDRGRVRRLPVDPIAATPAERHPEVATELRRQLAELGIRVGRIDTGLRTGDLDAPPGPRPERFRDPPSFETLLIAIEQPGRGWLTIVAPWPRPEKRIFWALVGQTLILYIVVLLPVLWAVRRMLRPLRDLTRAAEQFRPGAQPVPLSAEGPEDVAALITAFHRLSLRVSGMLDEKDRMLGAIGHDLRTPLAALRVRIESVEDETDRQRMAETIAEMNRTLDDILSLARLGRPSEPRIEVDLGALVDAVVEDFRDLGAPVDYVEGNRVTLRLRPSLMRRAVRNLIENAVKYGVSATVRIAPAGGQVAILVEDRGPGIPADRLEDVFDPFTRLEHSRNRDTGGIGLGLALARAIANEAGGEVTLANRPDGGLVATIILPR
ncbi:signal transduction histidine kinase [Sphingomonas abaci]|uniref:histidine kinase n=2 Tax=Sphingomonas abaci TaxID=237611 RepID=A0A7W7AKH1_9SPHN|nr:signal transduction histidine kinase [Sphingomonas abaci]